MQEWMEHQAAMEGNRKESISETIGALDEPELNTCDEECIDVQVAITIKKERQVVGIGVMTTDINGQEKALWAMRERSAGHWLLDYAEALKLAMAKARAQQWSRIKVGITYQQLLRQLRSGRVKDIRLLAQVEEIDRISSMFVQCSFYLIPDEQKDRRPLAELKHDDTKEEEEEENSSHIIEFLNDGGESSVVYVSFGSEIFLSEEDREEIAYGLELSIANFIWVLRFPVGDAIALEEALPEGFLERVKTRGVVVDGWHHRLKFLNIPALPHHARLAVEIGVGIEILRDEDGRIKRENVAKVIKEVVVEKTELGESVKQKAKELSHKLREEGEEELHEAVEELRRLCKG
nr:beta-D-glucosyl crocetin beta-1,6-glucosyltransferase-like [Coffea arabica]